MLTNYLAEVWGISIVAVCFALLIKDKHIKSLLAKIESDESLFMWGFMSFVIGISMVLAYNVWAWNWQIIITLLGWAALLKGLCLLFCPEAVKKYAKMMGSTSWFQVYMVILIIIGLIITYFGFVAQ